MEKEYSNLIPFSQMAPERHRELSRKGGIASGIARRAKRDRINNTKAEMIAEKELKGDELYLLCRTIKDFKQLCHKIMR